ncbi:uncharacterized protein LOC133198954 [Saccostrea echinata]|uniref:uncharacterized protein LOC133198954 n=1 Tax=Saccostrea echinata TaxID=191078 RepID=UPI002A7EC0B9|nr:uncharacterized protein LOC133198954 [Saccostrea echinata]
MVKRCSWGTCNTDSRYPDRLVGGIRFIPFPKPGRNLEKARRWIRLCGRPHNQLNEKILNERSKAKHLYVCSKHFVDGIPSERYPDPVSALATSCDSITPRRKLPTKRSHISFSNINASHGCSSMRKILADTAAVENVNIMTDMCSSTMPQPLEPSVQSLCSSAIETTPDDNSGGTFYPLNLLAVVAENKALVEEREKLLQNNSEFQQQFLQLQKLQERCFGCHKLKEKDYKYYTGFS